MDHVEFNAIVEEQYQQSKKTLMKKADEYAHGGDRFWNFNVAARMLNTIPEKALVGMKIKHDVSVWDLVELAETMPSKLSAELINEKITDSINYLILLKGMLIGRVNAAELQDKRFSKPTTTKGD